MAHLEFQKKNKVTLGLASQSIATTTITGTYWSMAGAHHAAVVFIVGTVTAAITLSVNQGNAPLATPATAATISGKTVTLGTADSDSIQIIEIEASELNVASSYFSIAAKAVAAGAGAIVGATVIRVPLRHEPAAYIT